MRRMSKHTRELIAKNLISFMEQDTPLLEESVAFIYNWVRRPDGQGTSQSYYRVWDMILTQYLPKERPLLFRSCERLSKRNIQSFTGKIYCAEKFSVGRKGHLLICDTKDYLQFENENNQNHKLSFFPLFECVKKAHICASPRFSKSFYEDCKKEDEYIVRVDHFGLYDLKWNKRK